MLTHGSDGYIVTPLGTDLLKRLGELQGRADLAAGAADEIKRAVRDAHGDDVLIVGLAPEWHGYLPRPFGEGYEDGLSLGRVAVDQLVAAITR